ncbi:helix-turn-helix transcriptional regulator [Agromyces sp. NPDC127015]|uniref:helix-turn-helix transcriptional regulator n=1 Tax=Agromyces sp. NPDC127015 TaxID=3347108 RepID=UPI00364E02C2
MGEVMRLRSGDVGVVEPIWQQFAPSARIKRVEPARFRFEWDSASLDGFSVVEYRLDADVDSVVDAADQLFVCQLTTPGGGVGTARTAFDAAMPWACSRRPVEASWRGEAQVRAFIFDLAGAERLARRMSGDDALRLRVLDPQPRSAAAGRAWLSAFDHVRRSLVDDGGHDEPLIAAELAAHALRITLAAIPTTYLDTIERSPQRGPADATVRRAMTYIDQHAREPITVDEVAEAVHISTRGLQYAFLRSTGESPMQYLRRVRLAGAHDELVLGVEAVAVVARRWGFGHSSRFARYYREQYGCTPSEQLRRARS